MNKKTCRVRFTFMLATFLFVLLFPSICHAQSPSNEPTQSVFETRRQVSQGTLEFNIWVFLSGRYGFFDLDVRDEVVVEITSPATSPTTPYVISVMIPFSLTKMHLPPGANYTYGFSGYAQEGILRIYLPANTSLTEPIRLEGHLMGKSVFWRNSAEISPSNITSSITYASSYRLILVPPSPSKVLSVHSRPYQVSYYEATLKGQRCLVISETWVPVVVLYEPKAWEIYAFIVMLMTIFMVLMIPYILKFRKIGAMTLKLTTTFRQQSLRKPIIILQRLYNELLRLNSSKLLTAYVLCGLLMISLGFVAGPNPRLKVFVLASTPETARTISDFVYREAGASAITTFDETGEFRTMANLGVFSAAIVGDFFPPERQARIYIYPALANIHNIIILRPYAIDEFSSEIQKRYAEHTVIVDDLDALTPILRKVERRTNALGLNVSPATYTAVSAFVGLSSFIIVFFGFSFLASKLIEAGKKPGVGGFPEAIASAILVFIFTEATYIVCGVLLAIPLGLHTSSPKVTAIGFMGFGGGSRPRMFAGLAGFLFGSLISLKEGLKLEKVGFMSFLVVGFFLIVDPLTNGKIFYEFVLIYTVGPRLETAVTTVSFVKDFLANIGVALGGWASPTYALSTGTILYYAGAIAFCLFPKLEKNTATAMLFFCAFCAASGGIRVADMKPWASIASLIPGVMVGFVFAALLSLISLAEMAIRTKIGKRSAV